MAVPSPAMDSETVWAHLQALIGVWEGVGTGRFPTINSFTYREKLEIEGGSAFPRLRFNQSSVRSADKGMTESHAEAGFIGVTDDATIEMTSAESLDRMELLSGHMVETEDGWRIELETREVIHDERVLSSWRTYDLSGDRINYAMGMSTGAVPDGDLHLKGQLWRRK